MFPGILPNIFPDVSAEFDPDVFTPILIVNPMEELPELPQEVSYDFPQQNSLQFTKTLPNISSGIYAGVTPGIFARVSRVFLLRGLLEILLGVPLSNLT